MDDIQIEDLHFSAADLLPAYVYILTKSRHYLTSWAAICFQNSRAFNFHIISEYFLLDRFA